MHLRETLQTFLFRRELAEIGAWAADAHARLAALPLGTDVDTWAAADAAFAEVQAGLPAGAGRLAGAAELAAEARAAGHAGVAALDLELAAGRRTVQGLHAAADTHAATLAEALRVFTVRASFSSRGIMGAGNRGRWAGGPVGMGRWVRGPWQEDLFSRSPCVCV